jgi:hypothetical protein
MSNDFWAFRTMVAPVIIQVIFWIGSAIAILIGLAIGLPILLGGTFAHPGRALAVGLGFILIGPLVVRIYCELLILFFRINETLTEIEHAVKRHEPEPTGPEAA